jgi:hypothetical protein
VESRITRAFFGLTNGKRFAFANQAKSSGLNESFGLRPEPIGCDRTFGLEDRSIMVETKERENRQGGMATIESGSVVVSEVGSW